MIPAFKGNQIKVRQCSTRFMVASIGRQFGKTTIGLDRIFERATRWTQHPWLWASPTYNQARIAFNRALSAYAPLIEKVNRSSYEIQLKTGGVVKFRSTQNAEALRGDTLSGGCMDECASHHQDVWKEIIRPMLNTTGGPFDFIGTPKGRNHFWEMFEGARSKAGWTRFQYASTDSPFCIPEEVEEAKLDLPDDIFRQEYLGQFVDDGGLVFSGINTAIASEGMIEAEPVRGRSYLIGLDLAQVSDFTVATVWNTETNCLVAWYRDTAKDYTEQVDEIVDLANYWNQATIIVETNGPGHPVYDMLTDAGAYVEPWQTTAKSKSAAVRTLAVNIKRNRLAYPAWPEMLSELRQFEKTKTPGGNIRYSAPAGAHDDIVMSMAIAQESMRTGVGDMSPLPIGSPY